MWSPGCPDLPPRPGTLRPSEDQEHHAPAWTLTFLRYCCRAWGSRCCSSSFRISSMLPAQSLGWLLGHHAQCPSPSPEPAPSPSSFPNPSLTCRDIQRAKLTCHSTGTLGIHGAPWSSACGSPARLPAVPPDSLTARSPGRVCRRLASGSPQGRHPAPAVCDWGTARDGEDRGKSASPWGRQG